MKIVNKLSYRSLKTIKEDFKVKKIYCLPVFWEWITEKELENIDETRVLFWWNRNWDWYFPEQVNDSRCEEFRNIYFFKERLIDESSFEWIDYEPVYGFHLYLKKWEDNWIYDENYFKSSLKLNA